MIFSTDSQIYIKLCQAMHNADYQTFQDLLKNESSLVSAYFPNRLTNTSKVEDYILLPCDHTRGVGEYDHGNREATTLLMACASYGLKKFVSLLLENGADVNAEESVGLTPLFFAILGGNEQIVMLLLDEGASVTGKTRVSGNSENANRHLITGLTPLHLASRLCSIEIVQRLLEFNPELESKDKLNRTPLDMAIFNRDKRVISELLNHKRLTIEPKEIGAAMHFLDALAYAGSHDFQCLARLAQAAVNDRYRNFGIIGSQSISLWEYACRSNCINAIKFMTEHHFFDLAELIGTEPLHTFATAVRNRAWGMASLLIDHGLIFNMQIFKHALVYYPLVEKIISTGFCPRPCSKEAWRHDPVAALINLDQDSELSAIILNLLFDNGASADTDDIGQSPLIMAAKLNKAHLVKVIARHAKDINITDHQGNTAIMTAASEGFNDIVTLLHSSGAKLNIQNKRGQSALMLATKNQHIETASLLTKYNADA